MRLVYILVGLWFLPALASAQTFSPGVEKQNDGRFPNRKCVPSRVSPPAQSASRFLLKEGDRVVFYGDSITEQGFYANYVEAFTRTRFPDRDVRFFNAGWAGDATWGGAGGASDERVRRDVQPFRPTVIAIMLGMNDGGYVPFDPKIYAVFQEWYGKLFGWMRQAAPDARFTLIETSPYDDFTRKPPDFAGYNATLTRFRAAVQELAQKENQTFVDFNAPLVSVLKKARALDAKQSQRLVPDFIHPAPAGHLIMAGELLKAWNAPSVVTTVTLDAAQKRVQEAVNTEVSDFDGLTWTQFDRALPFAVDTSDPTMALVLRCSDFMEQLNQERLSVAGLPAGTYRLTIENQTVGSFTAAQLAVGINLASLDTPMRRQALRVLEQIEQHNHIMFLRWREVQIPYAASEGGQAALNGLDKLATELLEKVREEAHPKACHYRLILLRPS